MQRFPVSSLSIQMENYFVELAKKLEGYEDFEKESLAFKVNPPALLAQAIAKKMVDIVFPFCSTTGWTLSAESNALGSSRGRILATFLNFSKARC